MEKNIPQLEIADYRKFIAHYNRRHIRKIEVSGPDIASVLPTFRAELARIARPDTVLLTVGVPSADDILFEDMVSLLECVSGGNNNHPNVCWGIREQADVPAVQVVAYAGISKD